MQFSSEAYVGTSWMPKLQCRTSNGKTGGLGCSPGELPKDGKAQALRSNACLWLNGLVVKYMNQWDASQHHPQLEPQWASHDAH